LIGNASDWLELAFTHEYTHILHLDRARGFMQGVRRVFGRAPLVFPNSYLPVWQIEGLAVFEESRMTGEGRIPEGDFRAIVDIAATRGRFEPIDRAGGGLVDWPAGEAPYAYGAYFHQYLADRFGPDRLSRLADATAGRVPLFGDGAFKQVFGRSSTELWSDFRTSRERAAPTASKTDAHASRLTHSGYDLTALDVDGGGVVRYAQANADRFPALMELSPGGTPRRLAWRAGAAGRPPLRGGSSSISSSVSDPSRCTRISTRSVPAAIVSYGSRATRVPRIPTSRATAAGSSVRFSGRAAARSRCSTSIRRVRVPGSRN
jgi:hypothetical protein